MNGVLVIDKPAGPTSHDVVAVARRVLGVSRIGHTGTLDPLATGVLALLIGRATRLSSLMVGADKEYVAGIRLGLATPTYDAEGREPDAAMPVVDVGVDDVAAVLREFVGPLKQTPPPFSAKKIGGTAAYKLARKGQPADIKPVDVSVTALSLQRFDAGLAEVRLVCSSGFYVRSLAHDIGLRLGCGAYLESLRRTRSGEFGLGQALTLDGLASAGRTEVEGRLIPMEQLLPAIPTVTLTLEGVERVRHGAAIRPADVEGGPPATSNADRARLLDASGALLGLAEPRPDGLLHPVVVLV
jgi:tRNA pseudouridine55 synthase